MGLHLENKGSDSFKQRNDAILSVEDDCMWLAPREARRPVSIRVLHEPLSSPRSWKEAGTSRVLCWLALEAMAISPAGGWPCSPSLSLSHAPLSPMLGALPSSNLQDLRTFWLLQVAPYSVPALLGGGEKVCITEPHGLWTSAPCKGRLARQIHMKIQPRGKNQGVPVPARYLEPNQKKIYCLSEHWHFKIPNKGLPGLRWL